LCQAHATSPSILLQALGTTVTGLIELALDSLSLYVVVDVAILVPLLPYVLGFVCCLGLNCLYLLHLCEHSIREG
jgi:hypothetical protein